MSLTELARAFKAPISDCHGIARMLAVRGYLCNIDAGRDGRRNEQRSELKETERGGSARA